MFTPELPVFTPDPPVSTPKRSVFTPKISVLAHRRQYMRAWRLRWKRHCPLELVPLCFRTAAWRRRWQLKLRLCEMMLPQG